MTVYPRDFRITYDVERNLALRSDRDRQLLLGPATAAVASIETDRGRRIVFVDEAQNFLWMYRADSYTQADAPLP